MRSKILTILSKNARRQKLYTPSTYWIIGICNFLLMFALFFGYKNYREQKEISTHFKKEVRERWENRPDKHPHRMAHYGYVAFREPYTLSFFDFGLDSFVGKAVFLEAHKQNTVNYSQASQSSSLLRFGEITVGLIFQLILPIFIFFWGYNMVAEDKENGTLRILKSQGVSWPELILGRTLGLISIASLIFTPTLIISAILLLFEIYQNNQYTILLNLIVLLIAYTIYFSIVAILALIVSTISGNKNIALMRLIGIWLLFTLILPKVSQVIAYNFYPSPSKIEFDSAVENDIIKLGDSHNPNDPYFKSLKDSLLKSYHVDSTHKLPFNFSGFIMREGEKLSAKTYLFHKNKLTKTYIDQQNIIRLSALINPFIAIKNISMAFTGTDYFAFNHFQNQTEDYRFRLAQYMNNLQIKYIGNKAKTSADKNSKINKSHWQNLPDFSYHFLSFRSIIYNEIYSIISLIIWLLITLLVVFTFPEKFKFI